MTRLPPFPVVPIVVGVILGLIVTMALAMWVNRPPQPSYRHPARPALSSPRVLPVVCDVLGTTCIPMEAVPYVKVRS